MKLIEIHKLQSFPITCLNRDELGSPKTAVFGGVQRARISSQAQKRPTRNMAGELCPGFFESQRTRLILEPLIERMTKAGIETQKATEVVTIVADEISKFDKDAAKKTQKLRLKTMIFLSNAELDSIAAALVEAVNENTPATALKNVVKKAIKAVSLKDAADIGIFGRMVASDKSLSVDSSCVFSTRSRHTRSPTMWTISPPSTTCSPTRIPEQE